MILVIEFRDLPEEIQRTETLEEFDPNVLTLETFSEFKQELMERIEETYFVKHRCHPEKEEWYLIWSA